MTTELQPKPLCCPVDVIVPEDAEALGQTAAVFKALSDPTRIRILKSISHMGQLCECNIVPAFGLSQPTISYHLKVLREAGLIASRRRGQWVWHQVNRRALLKAMRSLTELAE